MESIDEEVTYLKGYLERQEEREMREEEQAMRETQEYEERRQMNEHIWQQSEANCQLERRYHPFSGNQGSLLTFNDLYEHPKDQVKLSFCGFWLRKKGNKG